jgi:beta-1,2-mannobiose phosphorylase / 1,2-beta-oligomannan phosphorylase
MLNVERSLENPLILPDSRNPWEDWATFNGSPIKKGRAVHILYRALGHPEIHHGKMFPLSTIGRAKSPDGIHFKEHEQLIVPEKDWERFGCEDPRVTKLGNKYYIFYTALSTFPFLPEGITVGLAMSKDLKKVESKHHITHFNSKAMTLFPEKINGKITALLSVNTDRPPASIALAQFEKESDLWSREFWEKWHESLPQHALDLHKQEGDHVEIGAAPIKTKKGWLLIYSHIYHYGKPEQIFGIEAVLLDLKDPQKIVGRTETPLMIAQEEYERYGMVPGIIFPSGAYVEKDNLHIYYGASDTTVCRATLSLSRLLKEILSPESELCFERSEENPILVPRPENDWESKAVFNPAVFQESGETHIVYRAMGKDDTSVFGYATSKDGIHIDERLPKPIYIPRESFEKKTHPGNSGCEDPRFARLGRSYYVCYTAFDGINPPRVAMTNISVEDFLNRRFEKFARPKLISAPGIDDKDAILFPEKMNGQYVFIHRVQPSIHLNYIKSLDDFDGETFFTRNPILSPRVNMWDDLKVGLSATPIKTKSGWLLIYHGVSSRDKTYRVGAALLDLKKPEKILGRTRSPLLEPEMPYEKEGSFQMSFFLVALLFVKKNFLFITAGPIRLSGSLRSSWRIF